MSLNPIINDHSAIAFTDWKYRSLYMQSKHYIQRIHSIDMQPAQTKMDSGLNTDVVYAEWIQWAKKNGYAKSLRKQGILDNKGRLVV